MENIKNIMQNTPVNTFLDDFIIEEINEPKNTIKTPQIIKEYQKFDFYKKITQIQRDILDSDTIRELDRGGKIQSIYLCGESGIGKTIQSILCIRDYIMNFYEKNKEKIDNCGYYPSGFYPIYVRYNDILELINNRKFGNDEQRSSAYYQLRDMKEAYFLVIDDFSSQRSGSKSDWIDNEVDKTFQDLLEARYGDSENNITIITSNNTREEMQDQSKSWLSPKTYSRLLATCKRYARSNKKTDLRNN